MQFGEIWRREMEGVKMMLFSIAAFVLLNLADKWFGLVDCIGQPLALSVYGIISIFLYIPVATFNEWLFVSGRIKIRQVNEYRSEPLESPVNGKKYFIDLEVEIPKNWRITECYATLDSVVPVYYQDKKLIEPKIAEWIAEKSNPKRRRLLWESPYASENDCIINMIDSNKERFSIACVNIGNFKAKRKKVNINWLEFRMCGDNSSAVNIRKFGLYKIEITFHWKRNGKDMIPRKFSGYLYAEEKEMFPSVIVGEGNYLKNKRIPKPAT